MSGRQSTSQAYSESQTLKTRDNSLSPSRKLLIPGTGVTFRGLRISAMRCLVEKKSTWDRGRHGRAANAYAITTPDRADSRTSGCARRQHILRLSHCTHNCVRRPGLYQWNSISLRPMVPTSVTSNQAPQCCVVLRRLSPDATLLVAGRDGSSPRVGTGHCG